MNRPWGAAEDRLTGCRRRILRWALLGAIAWVPACTKETSETDPRRRAYVALQGGDCDALRQLAADRTLPDSLHAMFAPLPALCAAGWAIGPASAGSAGPGRFGTVTTADALRAAQVLGHVRRFSEAFVRLTGDDYGSSDTNEAWDVFYGGWPQYGDLLVWKYINVGPGNAIAMYDPHYNAGSTVGAEAVYSNFNLITAGIDIKLLEALKAAFSYSKLIADETIAGADDDIGDYYQLTAEYRYSKHLVFGMYAATIDPGAAFAGRSDRASEAFWDVTLSF